MKLEDSIEFYNRVGDMSDARNYRKLRFSSQIEIAREKRAALTPPPKEERLTFVDEPSVSLRRSHSLLREGPLWHIHSRTLNAKKP